MFEIEKSEDFIDIKIVNADYIKIESIINVLANIKNIIKYISIKIDKQSFVSTEVAFKQDKELVISIKVSASLMQSFIRENDIKLAEKILESLYTLIILKNHLNEGICKNVIDIGKNKIDIRNINDESYIIDKFIYDIYTEELDQYLKNVFVNYKEKTFILIYKQRRIELSENNINNMKRDLYIDKNIRNNVIKTEREVNLGIKKPDLYGNSQWEVINLYNNRIMRVVVEDKEFINRIHLGEILISAKTTINAKVCRETYLNEFNEHIKEVYIIRKVLNVNREKRVEQIVFT